MKKSRVLKSWSKRNVPFDLWPDILSRLPVKYLLQYRSVAKPWKAMIDDPEFRRSHLKNFQNNAEETHLLVDQDKQTELIEHKCVVRCSKSFKLCAELTWLDTGEDSAQALTFMNQWTFVCALDGLVVLKRDESHLGILLTLWNPSIRKSRVMYQTNQLNYAELGLGFDPAIQDYKYVRFVLHRDFGVESVMVYTVGARSWRTIKIQYEDIEGSNWRWVASDSSSWMGLHCKGSLYFTARINTNSDARLLVYFNLTTEKFGHTSLPIEPGNYYRHDTLTLLDGGSSLGAVSVAHTFGSIWVLKSSSGTVTGWTRRYTFSCRMYSHEYRWRYMMWIKKSEMLVQWNNWKVTSYNFETHEEKVLLVNGRRLEMSKVRCYVESLLLMDG